jgi:hypothetical protein
MTTRQWDKSKPPKGPFVLNKDCPQAQGLAAWYPFNTATPLNLYDYVDGQHLTGANAPAIQLDRAGAAAGEFVTASSKYFTTSSPIVTAMPLSMACWANLNNTTAPHFLVTLS